MGKVKFWKPIDDENCPDCGGQALVKTTLALGNQFYDGEDAKCEECGGEGWTSVDEDGHGIVWWKSEVEDLKELGKPFTLK